MKKIAMTLGFAVAVGVPCLVAWLNDFVTLHGAKTVYTADCAKGTWRDGFCSGTLVAGDRYRFKVLKTRSEVIFWTSGSAEPSGKLTPCVIESAKDWSCIPSATIPRAIIQAMKHGQPVAEPGDLARSYHPVPKWKWLLLDFGFPYLHEANW